MENQAHLPKLFNLLLRVIGANLCRKYKMSIDMRQVTNIPIQTSLENSKKTFQTVSRVSDSGCQISIPIVSK